jgi:hypothetical protein
MNSTDNLAASLLTTEQSSETMGTEYRRDDRHVYRHIAGEHLLISLHKDAVAPMFAFTPTAASLWGVLGEWTGTDRLVEHLLEHFEVEREEAEKDVREFLEQLLSIGALETREVGV